MTFYSPVSWPVVVVANLVVLGWAWVLSLRADWAPAESETSAEATHRCLFTAFAYASVVVLGGGSFALAWHGEPELERVARTLLESAGFPCFAPLLQVGGTLLVAACLACLASWGSARPSRLRVQDRVVCAAAGLGWGLVLVFTLSPLDVRF